MADLRRHRIPLWVRSAIDILNFSFTAVSWHHFPRGVGRSNHSADDRRADMSLATLLQTGRSLAERIPYSAVALLARVAVASVFWRSGQTKVIGLSIGT